MQPSPYTPGELARVVPGREAPLTAIGERLTHLAQLQKLIGRIRVDYGPRGRGKTSMLREAQRRADAMGLLTIWATATRDGSLVDTIVTEIGRRTSRWERTKSFNTKLANFSFKVGVGLPGVASGEVTWTPTPTVPAHVAARAFEDVLVDSVRLARKHDRKGIVIFIDEIQDADAHSLAVIAHAWQNLQAEKPNLPAAIFADGLPDARRVITAAVSPSERFLYEPLGPLSDAAVMVALVGPAEKLGVGWEPEALGAATVYAAGYPHSVQLIGDYTWRAAGNPDAGSTITAAHVAQAIADANDDLEQSYAARLARITRPRDLEFVRAMASLGDGVVTRAQIADELGLSSTSISDMRASLIGMGIIEEGPKRGQLQFTAPRFAAYVRANDEDAPPPVRTRKRPPALES